MIIGHLGWLAIGWIIGAWGTAANCTCYRHVTTDNKVIETCEVGNEP